MDIAIYYNNSYKTGGIERGMINLARKLNFKGHNVTYIFKDKYNIDFILQINQYANIKKLGIRDEDIYDLLIYEKYTDTPYIKANKKGVIINGNVKDWKENYRINTSFDFYISVSNECAKQFKEVYGIDSIVIPNYIHIPETIESLDLKRAKYNFVTISRIDDFKGFDKMLKVAEFLENKNITDYYWYVVGGNTGDPNTAERITKQFKIFERIIFVGEQSDPYPYMKNADTFLQLSKTESQCISFLEAKHMGLRTITTNFGTAFEYGSDYILEQDLNNLNIDRILGDDIKPFKYPNLDLLWEDILKPVPKIDYKYTVIIPNYNNSKWLEKCLNSVLNQTYKNIEIAFIDDMSTDNSLEIARYLLKDKGHKILVNDRKKWNGGSRNVGIEYAKQSNPNGYILCLDSDDWLYSDDCIEQINKSLKNEDIGLLKTKAWNGKDFFWELNPNPKDMLEIFKAEMPISCAAWCKVIKTKNMPYFCENTLMEDRVWHYRLINNCNSFTNIDIYYNIFNKTNESSVCTTKSYKWSNSAYRHIADMLDLLEELKEKEYIQHVKTKINECKKNISNNIFSQL